MTSAAVFFPLCVLLPILISFLVAIWALLDLRDQPLDDKTLALWVLIILAFPILGLAAYFVMRPGRSK